MNTHLRFPKVLCSEGSQVWLRSFRSATIYQSELGFGRWRETLCPTLSMHQPLCLSDISSITCGWNPKTLIFSPAQAWIDLLRWRTVRGQCAPAAAAAGHTLNNIWYVHQAWFKQHLDLKVIWWILFWKLTFSRILCNPTSAKAALEKPDLQKLFDRCP